MKSSRDNLFDAILLSGNQEEIYRLIEVQDPNIIDPAGYTPLHYAVKKGLIEIAQKLIHKGADPAAKNKYNGKTPLQIAEENENKEMIIFLRSALVLKSIEDKTKALGEYPDWNSAPLEVFVNVAKHLTREEQRELCLVNKKFDECIRNKHTLFGKEYLDKRKQQLNMQLVKAITSKNLNDVAHWLEQGADPNFVDGKSTPLYRAASSTCRSLAVIELLLESGADPNVCGYYKETPLHNAAQFCHKDDHIRIVELLIAKGAKVNVIDSFGSTALTGAIAGSPPSSATVVKYLIDAGADLNAATGYCSGPLAHAVMQKNSELVKLLINNGAHLTSNNNEQLKLVKQFNDDYFKETHPDLYSLIYTEINRVSPQPDDGRFAP